MNNEPVRYARDREDEIKHHTYQWNMVKSFICKVKTIIDEKKKAEIPPPIIAERRWVCGYGFGEPGNPTTVCPSERDCIDSCGWKLRPPRTDAE